MKNILPFFLFLIILYSITGCGQNNTSTKPALQTRPLDDRSAISDTGSMSSDSSISPSSSDTSNTLQSSNHEPKSTQMPERQNENSSNGNESNMTVVKCDFTQFEGPLLDFYIDTKIFEAYQPDDNIYGFRYRDEDNSNNAFLEISYVHSGNADILAPGLAEKYDDKILSVDDKGIVPFGTRYEARHVLSTGNDGQIYNAYVIPVETGAITVIISHSSSSKKTDSSILYDFVQTMRYEYQ